MKRESGEIYVSSIEEDCRFLRQCLAAESDQPFTAIMNPGKDEKRAESGWKDYECCRNMGYGLMKYAFDTPAEWSNVFNKLWRDRFSEEFILLFIVLACKWGNLPTENTKFN